MKKILCWLFGHDWDMTFPDKDRPLDWVFVCTRCKIKQNTQPDLRRRPF